MAKEERRGEESVRKVTNMKHRKEVHRKKCRIGSRRAIFKKALLLHLQRRSRLFQ